MNTDELRDALRADADSPVARGTWDTVQARGAQIRRRRRGAQGAVAMVSVVVIAAGTLALAGTFDSGTGRRGIVATPPGAVSNEIVAGVNGQIEVLSADDGHVVRTLADGTDPSVDKQGNVYFTRTKALPPVSTPCNTDLNQYVARVASTGGDPVSVVDNAAGALVSPDGHWLAYGSWQCNGDKLHLFLGLTDLRTGRNYRPFEQQFTAHPAKIGLLAWSPDSSELVFAANGETWDQRGLMALRDLPLAGGADPAQVPGGADVGGATFLPNGHLLAARATDPGRAYDVVELDGSGNVIGTRFSGAGFVPSLALDPSGQRLLVTFPNGSLSVREGTEQPRAVAPKVQGAAWLPAAPVGVGDVVAEQDNSIVMLSAVDGHVTRTIAADAAPGTGVAVTPDGSTVVYARPNVKPSNPGCTKGLETELVKVPVTGGTPTQVVPASQDPVISRDGQWVAYTINICGDGPALGITNLSTGANYRPLENGSNVAASIAPYAWTPDSARVLYVSTRNAGDEPVLALVSAPLGPQDTLPLAPTRCCVETYLPNGDLLAVFQAPSGYVLDEYNPNGGIVRSRLIPPGAAPSRIAVDGAGNRVLVARADGTLLVQEGNDPPRVIAQGVGGAAWLP